MKVINHYTKNKRKVAYTPLFRSVLKLNSRVATCLVKFQKTKFKTPSIKKVFIETISYCNNDCLFCPASTRGQKKDPKHKMTSQTFETIAEQLLDMKYSGVFAIYCNNEPLIDSRITNFVRKLREEFPLNKIEIITNGILLDAALAGKLFDSGLSKLIVNHYDDSLKLSKNLEEFIKAFSNSGYQDKVKIHLRLKNEILSNRAGQMTNAINSLKPLPLWCSLPFEQLYLNYVGDVVLCCSDVLWQTILGNINRTHIKEIWYGPKLSCIREALLEGRRDKIGSCKKCDFLGIKHNPKAIFSTMAMALGLRK